MQTGIISFGDRVAWNIKCNQTKDIILDDTHPKFEEYGGWNGVGTIFYDDVLFPFASETANVAVPFYSNHKFYPLILSISLFTISFNSSICFC